MPATRFGVHLGPQHCTIDELRAAWATSEQLGFEWVSTWDHFYAASVPLEGDCFEGIATHTALACATERVRVGCLVYSAGYRHPAVIANAMVTIDHLSGGRMELGMGAGWHQPEYDAYGIPFEAPAVRLRRMAEAIEVIRALWTEDTVTFDGEFFRLRDARCDPKPVQQPPRIWVGASGEQIGLKLAGRLGDGWNTPYASPDDFARKAAIVREHAARPTFQIGANIGIVDTRAEDVDTGLARRFGGMAPMVKPATLHGSPQQMAEQVGRYVEAGAGWIVLALRAPFDLGALELFATEVMPQLTR